MELLPRGILCCGHFWFGPIPSIATRHLNPFAHSHPRRQQLVRASRRDGPATIIQNLNRTALSAKIAVLRLQNVPPGTQVHGVDDLLRGQRPAVGVEHGQGHALGRPRPQVLVAPRLIELRGGGERLLATASRFSASRTTNWPCCSLAAAGHRTDGVYVRRAMSASARANQGATP